MANAPNPNEATPTSNSGSTRSTIPMWFWIVGIVALLWNLMGLMAFGIESMMTEEMLKTLPQGQQDLYNSQPSWVTIAFAVAVIAGTLGCVLLLMRRKFAIAVFGLSLLGVLGQQCYMFFLSDTFAVMGSAAMVLPILVLLIAIGLVGFAMMANSKGWLR